MSSWVECFVSIRFDLNVGPKVEHITPADALTKRGIDRIIQTAFPDSNNNYGHDFIFFFTMPDDTQAAERALLETISTSTGTARNMTKLYGATYYRQKYDIHVPRSCVQQAVVLLSRLPYFAIQELILRAVAVEFNACCTLSPDKHSLPIASAFAPLPVAMDMMCCRAESNAIRETEFEEWELSHASQDEVLDRAIGELAQWPTPHPRTHYKLIFLHKHFDFVTPSPLQRPAQSLVNRAMTKISSSMTPLNVREGNYDDKVFDPLPLYSLLGDHVHYLTYLWELIIMHEPLLVIGSNANVASACAYALASLIWPIEYNGVLRPYFTVQSEEFGRFSRMGEVLPFNQQEGIILAATNPFLMRQFTGWHNLLVVTDHSSQDNTLGHLSSSSSPLSDTSKNKVNTAQSFNQAGAQELNHTKNVKCTERYDGNHHFPFSERKSSNNNKESTNGEECKEDNEENGGVTNSQLTHTTSLGECALRETPMDSSASHSQQENQIDVPEQHDMNMQQRHDTLVNNLYTTKCTCTELESKQLSEVEFAHTMNLLRHVRTTSELTTSSSTVASPLDLADNYLMETGQTPLTTSPIHFSVSSSSFASANSSHYTQTHASRSDERSHEVDYVISTSSTDNIVENGISSLNGDYCGGNAHTRHFFESASNDDDNTLFVLESHQDEQRHYQRQNELSKQNVCGKSSNKNCLLESPEVINSKYNRAHVEFYSPKEVMDYYCVNPESPITTFTRAHYHAAVASATTALPVGCASPRTKHKTQCRNRLQYKLHNYFESNHTFYLHHSELKEILLKRLDAVSKLEPRVQHTTVSLTLSRWWGGENNNEVKGNNNESDTAHSQITSSNTRCKEEKNQLNSNKNDDGDDDMYKLHERVKSDILSSSESPLRSPETTFASTLFSQYSVADDIVRKFFTSLTMEFLTPITSWFAHVVESHSSSLRLCGGSTVLHTVLLANSFLQFFKEHHRSLAPAMWRRHYRYKTYKVIYERFARGVLFTSVINMLLMHNVRKELELFQVDEWVGQFPVQNERIDMFNNLYEVIEHELQSAPDPDINFVRNATSVLAAMAATVDVTLREQFMLKAAELQLEN